MSVVISTPFQLSVEECIQIVSRYLGHSYFDVLWDRIEVEQHDTVTGLMSEQARLRIVVHLEEEGGELRTLQFFVKYFPERWQQRKERASTLALLHTEIAFYRRAFLCMSPTVTPQCLLARGGDDALLVLEDLALRGFRPVDVIHDLDKHHCAVALNTLAEFHASSLAFPMDGLLEPGFQFSNKKPSLSEGWRRTVILNSMSLLERLPTFSRDRQRLRKVSLCLPYLFRKVATLLEPTMRHRCCVVHGYPWTSNLLFRYDGAGSPVEARLVDFQQVAWAPPALDVTTLLFTATTPRTRHLHLATLVDGYYLALCQALLERDVYASVTVPRNLFDESLDEYRLWGQMVAFLFCGSIYLPRSALRPYLASDDDIERFLRGNEHVRTSLELFHADEEYTRRVSDALYELLDTYGLGDETKSLVVCTE